MKKAAFLFFLFPLLFISCKRELTSWSSNWVLPLFRDTLDLKELVQDTILGVSNGFYTLDLKKSLFELDLGKELKIPDTTIIQKSALSLNSLNVVPGFEFLSEDVEHVLQIEDAQLKKMHLKEGSIAIRILSPYATASIFTLQLPKITRNGVPLSKSVTAPAGSKQNPSEVSVSIDLSNCDLDLTGEMGTSYNRLTTKMQVKSDPNGSTITITNQDSVRFYFTISSFKMDYARGYFGQYTVQKQSVENVDFLNKIVGGTLKLDDIDFNVFIENGIKADAHVAINGLSNRNVHTGTTVALQHPNLQNPFLINSATGTWNNLTPSYSQMTFNASTSNIEPFLENLGSEISLDYAIQLNPHGNISAGWNEYFSNSLFKLGIAAQMPLKIAANQLMLRDTFALNWDNSKDKFHIESGSLKLHASNAFPLEATVKLLLLDEWNQILSAVGSLQTLKSSTSDYLNSPGSGLQIAQSDLEFGLTDNQLNSFSKVKKIAVQVVFNTYNLAQQPSQTHIPVDAFISLYLSTNFKLGNAY